MTSTTEANDKPERILVEDDEDAICEIMTSMLTAAGHDPVGMGPFHVSVYELAAEHTRSSDLRWLLNLRTSYWLRWSFSCPAKSL